MIHIHYARAAACLVLATGLLAAGCGLKGPLSLPEKSQRVIIRGPGETASPAGGAAAGATATGGGTATGGTATDKPAEIPVPAEERPPPPPLPGGGNTGAARGG